MRLQHADEHDAGAVQQHLRHEHEQHPGADDLLPGGRAARVTIADEHVHHRSGQRKAQQRDG